MKRRRFITCALGTAGLAGIGTLGWNASRGSKLKKVSRSSEALGTRVHISVFAESRSQGEAAIDAALAAIEEVESTMSLYRKNSELRQLNRFGAIENPSPALMEVLQFATNLSRQTDGAFDITVQPLWELHSRCKQMGTFPSLGDIELASEQIDWRKVQIESFGVQLNDGARITLNGIAQGYAADAARAALKEHGIEHAMLDTGELSAVGDNPEKEVWKAGIQHPRETGFIGIAQLEDRCLATSGDYETTFNHDLNSHHLFDPKTGQSANDCCSVSVVAPSALQADALSTACFVLGMERGMKLIDATPDCDALFVSKNGETHHSAGFPLS